MVRYFFKKCTKSKWLTFSTISAKDNDDYYNNLDVKVIGGKAADDHEYPWMAGKLNSYRVTQIKI